MRPRFSLLLAMLLVVAACGDDDGTGTTSTAPGTTSSTVAVSTVPPSTVAPATTTPATTTTAAPTTTAPLPGPVLGLEVSLGGGSEEVSVTWDFNPEPYVDHYAVYFALTSGGSYGFVTDIADDAASPTPGRPGFVDWPRDQTPGDTCYRVAAVNVSDQEGPLSEEVCFDPEPGAPSQVQDVTVGLGGGSLEVAVTWQENPESDVKYYDVYFSATPGGSYSYTRSIADDAASPTPGRPGYVDYPRDQTVGMTCYRVRAIDFNINPGPLSAEACFQP